MSNTQLDVVAVGNAIVDVLSRCDDETLERLELNKGAMTLIDAERAEYLYAQMGPGIEISGGSAANTVAGLASLGGRAGFVGKVHNDQLGEVFGHDIRATGVDYDTPPLLEGPPTARCLIFITPDAQRTMNTYLGASVEFDPGDLNEDMIRDARVTYLEGYLFDKPKAKEAYRRASQIAEAAGREVALSLSDSFCVERHRDELQALVDHHVDILFANEDEIKSLYQVDSFEDAVHALRGKCKTAALTRSEKGSVVLHGEESYTVPAYPVAEVVDTTGTGDLYAAGFLYGYTQGESMADCGRIGGIAAAEVISHVGARPEQKLSTLIAAA